VPLLSQVFAAVETAFATRWTGERVAFSDGPEHDVDGGAPRVVWVPTEDSFSPAAEGWIGEPHAVATREAGTEARIWGKTRDQAEEVLQKLIVALGAACGLSVSFGVGRWATTGPDALTQYGRRYVLPVTFLMPVLEDAVVEGTVSTTDTTDIAYDPSPSP
jgi:hypothetical protein